MSSVNRFAVVLFALTVLAASRLWAAPNFDQSPFGVNCLKWTEFAKPDRWHIVSERAAGMKAAGVYWDRDGFDWSTIQKKKGEWDWTWPDKAATLHREQGINGVILLCYGAPWRKGPPLNDEQRAEYAEYVYQVVNRYKDTFKVWEIWNEPNIPSFWNPPDVKAYTLMLKEAYKAAKKADPTCTVLAGSVNGPGNDFIEGIYENGGWDYCDGFSIHPYTMCGGPIEQKLDRMFRHLNALAASHGSAKPLWVTEVGFSAKNKDEEERQATQIIQAYIILIANDVRNIAYFCMDNYKGFGWVTNFEPLEPKLSFGAVQMMTRILGSPGPCAPFEGYLKTPDGVSCYVFKKQGNERVLVMWSNDDQTRTVQLSQAAGLSAKNILGKPLSTANGKLEVGPLPIFVTGADARKIGQVSRDFNPYLAAEARNLVNNPSFEKIDGDHPALWNFGRFYRTDNHGKFAISDEGRDGSKCVCISGSGADTAIDAGPIPVKPGKKYKLTAWIKTKDATGVNVAGIWWYNGSQWRYRGKANSRSINGTQDWTKVEVEGVCPSTAPLARIDLISEGNKGTVWFDDVTLVEE